MRARTVLLSFSLFLSLLAAPARAVSLSPGDLVVVDAANTGGAMADGAVYKVDPGTGAVTLISSGGELQNPEAVTMLPNGLIAVSDATRGAVILVNPADGSQTILNESGVGGSTLDSPFGIDVDANGDIVLADRSFGGVDTDILGIDAVGGVETFYDTLSVFGAFHIAIEADGDILVTETLGSVARIDPTGTNAPDVFATSVDANGVWGIVVAGDGTIYATNSSGGDILSIDPVMGTPTTEASPGGQLLGMAEELDGNLVVVQNLNSLIRVDPSDWSVTPITMSPPWIQIFDVAVVIPEPGTGLLLGSALLGLGLAGRRGARSL